MPELINIFSFCAQQDQPIRTIRGKKRIGSAITPDVPPMTADIVERKRSRFGSLT